MAATDQGVYGLNSGEVSRLALARVDLAKLKMACEVQSNWLPHVLGPTAFRPGTQYIERTRSDLAAKTIEWCLDEATKALLVLTPLFLQVMVADAYITRGTVTAAVTNGDFTTNLAGWTNSDEAGATSAWAAATLALTGTGTNFAYRDQLVTNPNPNVEHALRVVITHGTVTLRVGTVIGDGAYWDVDLLPGTYSLAFVPTGDYWIRLGANATWPSAVDSINVEAAGTVALPTPWDAGDLANIFYDQSEDVIFVACKAIQQRRIEHRAGKLAAREDTRSWGVALYQSDDGPFRLPNLGATAIAPSAVSGNVALVADRPFFSSLHVGALIRLTHPGQAAFAALAGATQFTGAIRVSGIQGARAFGVNISGTFVAIVTLQHSIGAVGSWVDVEQYTAPISKSFNDGLDNQIIFYRLGITGGNWTSGTANAQLDYTGSVQTGIGRINTVTDAKNATCDVLVQFGATTATSNWSEGEWSTYRGWPGAVALHDGRLFWQLRVKIFGSVSDAFASYDDTVVGDAGPIGRVIATGGRDGVRWLLSLQRLLAGTASQEIAIRSSALDEPLSHTAFTARVCATRGAARVRALRVDTVAVYVSRNAKRIFALIFDPGGGDYVSHELTRLKQEMCAAGVKDVAIQRQPDTRIWFVLNDGTCAVLTYEPADEVLAWTPVITGATGAFETVAVLPGTDEDDVYFTVARSISGGTQRFVEKLAKRSECVGGTQSKTVDAHITFSGAPTTTVTAAHLKGQTVVVWADGAPMVTVDSAVVANAGTGVVTLPFAASSGVIGLAYTGQIKTVKLVYAAEHGTALTMQKRVARVGLVMADLAWKGLKIGRDFAHMTGLPATYRGKALTVGQVLPAFDAVPGSFNGGWDSDARVCIEIKSPYCATIMGLALEMTTNEPDDRLPDAKRAA